MAMTIRDSPVVAVSELVIRFTPGVVAERAIAILGHWDKPVLVAVILLILGSLFAWAGRLSARRWWSPLLVYGFLAAVGTLAVALQYGSSAGNYLPLAVGFVTWLIALSLLTEPLRRAGLERTERGEPIPGELAPTRRGFLLRAGLISAASIAVAMVGRAVGRGRRHVEETRRLLKI